MKKMWKMNNKAVSPVIATILMVAITVVLAAVLYVMVMGFGGDTNEAPTASLTASASGSSHQTKITVASISENVVFADMQLSIVNQTNVDSPVVAASMTLDSVKFKGYTLTFVDLAADGKVSSGDYFLLNNPVGTTTVGQTCTVNLLWGGDSVSIAADSWTMA